jgi:hypothetical protein
LTRDSRYGSAETVRQETRELAGRWGVAERVEILTSREDLRIEEADVVTNLGLVRPLDRALVQRLKPTAVIPLMWETWEYRPEDLDLEACRERGIAVLGTNEHHPSLQTMEQIGYLALKLIMQLDIEIWQTRVAVLGSGAFLGSIVATLERAGAGVDCIQVNPEGRYDPALARQILQHADVLVLAEHSSRHPLIDSRTELSAQGLGALNPSLSVAHICGGADREALQRAGLHCLPERFAPAGYMSVALDFVGPKPLIELHAAGLKVGEMLARARLAGLPALEAEYAVLKQTALAQGFAGYHRQERT